MRGLSGAPPRVVGCPCEVGTGFAFGGGDPGGVSVRLADRAEFRYVVGDDCDSVLNVEHGAGGVGSGERDEGRGGACGGRVGV